MKKQILLLLFSTIITQLFAQPTISIESFGPTFDKPVNIKHAGDDRLFVVEQEGFIQILNTDGTVNSTAFLDIENRVGGSGIVGDERGLLGLAFHPNYASNGFFYVNYINNSGNTVISRFSVSATDVNIADATSELTILTIAQPATNHNGGDMAFDIDGFLYISSGDGGGSGDPTDKGQDLESLLGKILRIDVDNPSNGNNYGIPSSNPFVSNEDALDEIWAYGLRNPWKFSFDKETNDIWIADVGQRLFEEINMVPIKDGDLGLNYGWRCYEGNNVFNDDDCPDMSDLTFPVAVYSHSTNSRCSITGGYRYRGKMYPNLVGVYFFADYCSNEIGTLVQNGTNWGIGYSEQFNGNGWGAFGEDVNGELYIAGVSSGTIYKIKDATLSTDDVSFSNFKMYPNPTENKLNFDFNNIIPESITFYDIQGRSIKKSENFSKNNFTISTQNFNKGFYFVEILDSNGKKISKKLLIE